MARGAKRLAAFLGTEKPNNLHDEPAYEDKLRMISETISELTVESGPGGVPVIVEPSDRKEGEGEENAMTPTIDGAASDVTPTTPKTVVEISETPEPTSQMDDITAEYLCRPNAPTSQVMKRLSTLVRDDSHEVDDLKALVESGQTVVELDPKLIDESFIRDRMEDGSESIIELARQIEDQGQLVPSLVRPHP